MVWPSTSASPAIRRDDADAERANPVVRPEATRQNWFINLDDARKKNENRRHVYNEVRPQGRYRGQAASGAVASPRGVLLE